MTKTTLLLASVISIFGFLSTSALANKHSDCDAHAKHIDHIIGAKKAIEAYHILHGDTADTTHVIETLKKAHPKVEHELEEFVKSGCSIKDLEAHAHDDDKH
ncbi:MAG: hypothetical protein ACPG46_12110 [Thalassotalea sp.]